MEWHHLPITDVDVPDADFEAAWVYSGLRLRDHLRHGRNVLVHCRGGLGRSGTIAARLLVELGWPAADAIAAVRAQRKGAIETSAQEQHVRQLPGPISADADAATARVLGCVLGGAVGDAFGYEIEFDRWPAIERKHGASAWPSPPQAPVSTTFWKEAVMKLPVNWVCSLATMLNNPEMFYEFVSNSEIYDQHAAQSAPV